MVRSGRTAPVDPMGSGGYPTGMLLHLAHRVANRAFNEALSGLDVEPRHFGVLAQLARQQPLSQRQLIDLLNVDKSAMVRTVDELERRGLVVRRPDPHDRRARAVSLTNAGDLMHQRAEQAAVRASEQIFGHLSPTEHHDLHNLLRKVIDADDERDQRDGKRLIDRYSGTATTTATGVPASHSTGTTRRQAP